MFANIRRYLVALTVVIALAVAYQSFVTPHLRPPAVKAMQLATMPPLDRFSDSLKDLFPDEPAGSEVAARFSRRLTACCSRTSLI